MKNLNFVAKNLNTFAYFQKNSKIFFLLRFWSLLFGLLRDAMEIYLRYIKLKHFRQRFEKKEYFLKKLLRLGTF